jgi:lysophospholipase L1-like esterase
VSNNGHQGDRAVNARVERLPELLNRKNRSNRALLLIGTNDSNDFRPTPSGKGCTGNTCDNTYKGHMQSAIRGLRSAGLDTIYVGILAPVWGSSLNAPYADPLDLSAASRNQRIVEFNMVISGELLTMANVKPGPDLFSCFLTPTVNRFSLFKDTLHPNALGYVVMAALWRDAITGTPATPPFDSCPSPVYILESLDPYVHGHKQNLLEEGDEYYTDEAFILTNIPSELANGIWVSQANADRGNRDEEFLTFDAGQSPVSVYIAFDPAGNPPLALSHVFEAVTLSADLTVSDPGVGALSIVKASGVTGWVSIGGNSSASNATPQQGYVVVVVP